MGLFTGMIHQGPHPLYPYLTGALTYLSPLKGAYFCSQLTRQPFKGVTVMVDATLLRYYDESLLIG